MPKIIFGRDFDWEYNTPEDFKIYKSKYLKEYLIEQREYIKRSRIDRRSCLDRRVLKFSPDYPDDDRRMINDRRKGWDDRVESRPATRWRNFSREEPYRS